MDTLKLFMLVSFRDDWFNQVWKQVMLSQRTWRWEQVPPSADVFYFCTVGNELRVWYDDIFFVISGL